MPKRRQAITWIVADPLHWRIYAALGVDELTISWRRWSSSTFDATLISPRHIRPRCGHIYHTYPKWNLRFASSLDICQIDRQTDVHLTVLHCSCQGAVLAGYYQTSSTITNTTVGDDSRCDVNRTSQCSRRDTLGRCQLTHIDLGGDFWRRVWILISIKFQGFVVEPVARFCIFVRCTFNALKPRQKLLPFYWRHLKSNFLDENCFVLIQTSLEFVSKCPIKNNPALDQIMARRRTGDEPLSDPLMAKSVYAYLSLCFDGISTQSSIAIAVFPIWMRCQIFTCKFVSDIRHWFGRGNDLTHAWHQANAWTIACPCSIWILTFSF